MSDGVAYVVLAHKHPRQLGRLVRMLDPVVSPVLVHVDARTDDAVHRAMREALDGMPNVRWLPRHRCRWGGFGTTAAALDGIAAVVEDDVPAGHVALLTGQDLPVKPAAAIRTFLAGRETSYLAHAPVAPAGAGHGVDARRFTRWWFHLAGRHRSLPARRRVPGGRAPYAGLAYWCLARAAAEEVHRVVRAEPELVRFFRHVAAPDEMLFQTVLENGPLADTVQDDPLRWVDFRPGQPSPRTLTSADLPAIRALPPNGLWARKFDEDVDAAVIDAVEAMVAG